MTGPVVNPNGSTVPNLTSSLLMNDSNCKRAILTIIKIAIQILVPLGTALALYFTLPLWMSVLSIPSVTAASIFAINFFFVKATQTETDLPMPTVAPCGLRNVGNDCWLNSLLQMIRIDPVMLKWFSEVPDSLYQDALMSRYITEEEFQNIPDDVPRFINENFAQLVEDERNTLIEYMTRMQGEHYTPDEKENIRRYVRFLREFQIDLGENQEMPSRVNVAYALLEFKKFMDAYNQGERSTPGEVLTLPAQAPLPQPEGAQPEREEEEPIPADGLPCADLPELEEVAQPQAIPAPRLFCSHQLRQRLAAVNPEINRYGDRINENSQQDPDEALRVVIGSLLPGELKVQMRETITYDVEGKPHLTQDQAPNGVEVIDGRMQRKLLDIELPIMGLEITGSYPNAQDMMNRSLDKPNPDLAEGGVMRNVLIGEVNNQIHYRRLHTKVEYTNAPPSFLVTIKRYIQVKPKWVGLNRIWPNWFQAEPARQVKNEGAVDIQDNLQIKPANGNPVSYVLDGFIVHIGKEATGGHYISYKKGLDDAGNSTWFEMNDSRVKRLSDSQMLKRREKAYIAHYSRI